MTDDSCGRPQPEARTAVPTGIRLVASDVDGTLLHDWQPIPAPTVEAIRSCLAAGVHFVPVTGRPIRWLAPIRASVPELGPVICANGSIVYDLAGGRVVSAHTVDAATLAEFVARVRRHMPEAVLGFETLDGLLLEPDFLTRFPADATWIDPTDSPHVPGVVKVLLRTGSRDSDAMLAAVRAVIGDTLHATHSNPRNGLVELAAPGVTKAGTLAAWCSAVGIGPHEVAAFGDMPNDIEMLAWAGSGYAMANGHPDAIAAAGGIVPAVLDGGITAVLQAIAAQA
ncbi:HAD family hydrolase [Brevibacterium ihuae]|uniref:HAD family hydrolase n=1 Tax=Brevibacterium ihuae TaxID=1631743 RepID=UPI000C77BBB1|nr:HAD family hydrolase [Brevibacterium ihuae]